MIISILLYGAETWTLKALDVRRLTVFHNHCVRTILGVSRFGQWKELLPLKIYQFSLECPGRLLITFWSEGCSG